MKFIFTLISFLFFSFSQAQKVSLTWAKAMGGTAADVGYSVAVDGSGNVYTTGYFEGTVDFNPDPAVTFNLTSGGAFVSKLDAAGNFVWARKLGSVGTRGLSVAVDGSGNVYTTGYFSGTVDFDPDPAAIYNLSAGGDRSQIFISKLDAAGKFVYAIGFGDARGFDEGRGITVDATGNVYTTGYFQGIVDFNPDPAVTFNLTSAGSNDTDIFVSKLNTAGNFVWARNIGGSLLDYGNAIAVDTSGNVYTTGYFEGTADFNPDPAVTFNLTSAGRTDVFVSKLDAAGNFIWAKRIGGLGDERGNSIAVDLSGNVLTTGYFQNTLDFDPDPAVTFNLTSSVGSRDVFVSKLNAAGNFVWAKNMADEGNSIAVDAAGNVYTTGFFAGTADFNPDPAVTFNLTSAGGNDIFVSKLNSSGMFVWAINMGSSLGNIGNLLGDIGNSIAVDAAGNVYSTGYFTGTADFNPDPAATFNLTSAGSADIFVVKLSQAAALPVTFSGFTIQKNNCTALLKWTTAFEQNSKYFEVQSSTDGVTFTTISTIHSGGNSNAEKRYSYSSSLVNQNNYFRLRIVDLDGSTKFSPVVSVTGNCDGNNVITVFPNPAKNRIYIQGATNFKQIQILDVHGRLIKKLQPSINNNYDVQFLRPGTYWIQLIGDGEMQTHKLIKE